MRHNLNQNNPLSAWGITNVLECKRCVHSCPPNTSLQDYVRITVGLTPYGVQVWCKRHQVNVAHFDFRGSRVAVNVAAQQGVIWQNTH